MEMAACVAVATSVTPAPIRCQKPVDFAPHLLRFEPLSPRKCPRNKRATPLDTARIAPSGFAARLARSSKDVAESVMSIVTGLPSSPALMQSAVQGPQGREGRGDSFFQLSRDLLRSTENLSR